MVGERVYDMSMSGSGDHRLVTMISSEKCSICRMSGLSGEAQYWVVVRGNSVGVGTVVGRYGMKSGKAGDQMRLLAGFSSIRSDSLSTCKDMQLACKVRGRSGRTGAAVPAVSGACPFLHR